MRIILTTVNEAEVKVREKVIAKINRGFLLLAGFTDGDNKEIVDKMVDKVLSLRVFPDEHGQINISLQDINGDILSVSQFTLYASAKKGRRPSFISALNPNSAKPLYEYFNDELEHKYKPIQTGIFGADMKVNSINDGPFTLILDSEDLFS